MGFTWYGGLTAGTLAAVVMVRRWQLPLGTVAGAAAAPLSVGYAVGRLGCLLSGDGTYGRPTTFPWGMTFPNGVVATDVPVHPTPLYEAIGALVIAAILWWLGRRANGPTVFAAYLILSSAARFLVEFLRTNSPAFLGMTQAQLWAVVGVTAGVLLAWVARQGGREAHVPVGVPGADAGMTERSRAGLVR
jgi:phosphatidylglycerol:prolipoprotein diacylglycerol transferase